MLEIVEIPKMSLRMSKSSRCYVEHVGRIRSFLTRNTEIQEHVRRSINCGKRRGNFGTGTDNNQNTFSTVSKTIGNFILCVSFWKFLRI